MTGHVPFDLMGNQIVIPLDEIWHVLSKHDQTTTFGGAREMYASNVYLRGFKNGLSARNVVDLGSNRGLFLILAAKVLGAEQAIGVEPQDYYAPVFELLLDANDIDAGRLHRLYKFASATTGPNTITMQEIMEDYDIPNIDFLKCDIEGGEFDVFLSSNDFIDNVSNISMELHPAEGDVSKLVRELQKFDFEVRVTDQVGAPIREQEGHYLYASRNNSLAAV